MNEAQPETQTPTIETDAISWLNGEMPSREYFGRWGQEEALRQAVIEANLQQDDHSRRPVASPMLNADAQLWLAGELESDEYFAHAGMLSYIIAEAEVKRRLST